MKCPRSAVGRPLTAGSGVGGWLPGLDGGPGGARGAPPAIDHMTMNDWAALHRVVVDEDADEVVSARSAPSIRTTDSFRVPLASSRKFSRLPVEVAPSRPSSLHEPTNRIPTGASRAGDSANHLTGGSRIRGPANAQPRGFITPTMRPMMSAGRGPQIQPTSGLNGAPESTSSQLRGLIISVPGVHDCRTSPSIRCPPVLRRE